MTHLIAIGGHTGTGKTTLAYGLQKSVPFLRSALLLDDDQIRREQLGFDLAHTLYDTAYAPSVSARVTEEITRRTITALKNAIPVINPSGFFAETSRKAIEQLAIDLGINFIGLWLVAPKETMKQRIAQRLNERKTLQTLALEQGHASDADETVIDKYGDIGTPQSPNWKILNATLPKESLLTAATKILLQKRSP